MEFSSQLPVPGSQFMIKRLAITVVVLAAQAWAATYYVDPLGSNANDGLSPLTPWRTLLKGGHFDVPAGGRDSVQARRSVERMVDAALERDGGQSDQVRRVWQRATTAGSPGTAPTTAAQWTNASGNVWQTTLSAAQAISQLNFVQFGTIWGNSQASANALAHDRDWFYDPATQSLSVYSSGGNPVIAFAGAWRRSF